MQMISILISRIGKLAALAGFALGAPLLITRRIFEYHESRDVAPPPPPHHWLIQSVIRCEQESSSSTAGQLQVKKLDELTTLISTLLFPTFSWRLKMYNILGQINLPFSLQHLAAVSEDSNGQLLIKSSTFLEAFFHLLESIDIQKQLTDAEQVHLAKFLANISQFPESHANLSALCHVIEAWMQRQDSSQLSLYAHKIHVNILCHRREEKPVVFRDRVYPLAGCVRYESEPEREFDIIFLNGMRGSVFYTWRQCAPPTADKASSAAAALATTAVANEEENPEAAASSSLLSTHSQCWPRDWLPQAFPTSRIIAVDVTLRPFLPRKPLHELADDLAQQLRDAGVGDRPIVWIAHSIGGLLVKYILRGNDTNNANNDSLSAVLQGTRGVLFLSTPHWGKRWVIGEFKYDHPALLDLHDWFISQAKTLKIRTTHLVEATSTPIFSYYSHRFVTLDERDNSFDEVVLSEEKDHIYICKPSNLSDPLYKRIVAFIRGSLEPVAGDEK